MYSRRQYPNLEQYSRRDRLTRTSSKHKRFFRHNSRHKIASKASNANYCNFAIESPKERTVLRRDKPMLRFLRKLRLENKLCTQKLSSIARSCPSLEVHRLLH